MTDSLYRELTPWEMKKGEYLMKTRTQSECAAYRLLPRSMRQRVERNTTVAFTDSKKVYFPDLLLRRERICIEIDGAYHNKRKEKDDDRDQFFIIHGFIIIRIKNQDTQVNVAFWQQLLGGLEKNGRNRDDIRPFILELRQMIDDEIQSWTVIE